MQQYSSNLKSLKQPESNFISPVDGLKTVGVVTSFSSAIATSPLAMLGAFLNGCGAKAQASYVLSMPTAFSVMMMFKFMLMY